jgi:hypothetical protein
VTGRYNSGAYIPAALHRAILRASKNVDVTTRAGADWVLRELLDGERVYLKELPPKRLPRRLTASEPEL